MNYVHTDMTTTTTFLLFLLRQQTYCATWWTVWSSWLDCYNWCIADLYSPFHCCIAWLFIGTALAPTIVTMLPLFFSPLLLRVKRTMVMVGECCCLFVVVVVVVVVIVVVVVAVVVVVVDPRWTEQYCTTLSLPPIWDEMRAPSVNRHGRHIPVTREIVVLVSCEGG